MNNYKRLSYFAVATIPPYLLTTILMQKGLSGLENVVVAMLYSFVAFIVLIFVEKSAIWNGAIAFGFWLPLLVLHLLYPAKELIAGDYYYNAIQIIAFGIIHDLIQGFIRASMNVIASFPKVSPNGPVSGKPSRNAP